MPRSYRPAAYGAEYELFLRRAISDGGFTLSLPSNGHARAFRGKLYAYFKALRKDLSRPDLAAMCDSLSLAVEGCNIRAFPVADSWDNCLLRDALGIEKGAEVPPAPALPAITMPVEPTAQEKLVARLAEIRSRNSK
jgi:hypothetical protein